MRERHIIKQGRGKSDVWEVEFWGTEGAKGEEEERGRLKSTINVIFDFVFDTGWSPGSLPFKMVRMNSCEYNLDQRDEHQPDRYCVGGEGKRKDWMRVWSFYIWNVISFNFLSRSTPLPSSASVTRLTKHGLHFSFNGQFSLVLSFSFQSPDITERRHDIPHSENRLLF